MSEPVTQTNGQLAVGTSSNAMPEREREWARLNEEVYRDGFLAALGRIHARLAQEAKR